MIKHNRTLARRLAMHRSKNPPSYAAKFFPRCYSICSNDVTAQSVSMQKILSNNRDSNSILHNKDKMSKLRRYSSSMPRKYKYFQNVEITPTNIAIITFDGPKSVNTISFELKDEAKVLWNNEVESNPDIKGVVFLSSKKDNFIAGADIQDINELEDKEELFGVIEDGMDFFQKMKKKKIPLVVGIDGSALGGGLEWALWTDYRVATDNKKTKMGLPEVKLGLLPGFGGTQNLHPLVGLQNALDMMLTGKEVRAEKAKKMGLVDTVVDAPRLRDVAIKSAEDIASGKLKPKRKKKSLQNWFLENTPVGRHLIWNQVQKTVQKNTNGNYPAPYKIMDCVKNGIENPSNKYKYEREKFVELAQTAESEALIGIFEGMTAMKKHEYGQSHPVSTVAVLGSGLMGSGIAQVSVEKGGYDVLLKDTTSEALHRGMSYMTDNWKKKVKRRRMTNYESCLYDSRITPLTEDLPSWQKHFRKANVVIEAVFEDLDLKRKIVKMVEENTSNECIFATNTSAIPISSIAENALRPNRILGMHYFSPVPSMPLLEIIPHEGTEQSVIATAFEVGTKQGKTCIVVKDVPGFYVNRCLGPFLVETSALLKDGVPIEKIDKAMKNFGMPVGPITLADEVGIDVSSKVASFLYNADLGVRMDGGDVSLMQTMVEKGWLGKKTLSGFYNYDKKTKKKKGINPEAQSFLNSMATQKLDLSETEIQDRLVSRFVNEAVKCLEDQIIANPVQGDIGMVFGTGFAPFRGGPFRYLDGLGVSNYVDKMRHLQDTNSAPWFEPCQLLKDYALSGKKFHG